MSAKYLALAAQGRMQTGVPLRQLATLCKLSAAKLPELAAALECGQRAGVVRRDGDQWCATLSQAACEQLTLMLRGVCLYMDGIHEETDSVAVVISKPAEPSQLVRALNSTLEGTWDFIAQVRCFQTSPVGQRVDLQS